MNGTRTLPASDTKVRLFVLPTLAAMPAAGTICAFSWLMGFDFDERGAEACMTAYFALFAAVITWLGVYWKLKGPTP